MIKLTNKERFLRACRAKSVDRPPVWFMRQAGRCLPEYRKFRKKYSFLELVKTPELAAKVTLQPIERFGFDAAILFSDILVIPEALGFAYKFDDASGMAIERRIKSDKDVQNISPSSVLDKLRYVSEAVKILKKELCDRTALIGFCGSPWTLACYIIEGSGSKEFYNVRRMFYDDKKLLHHLLSKLSSALCIYLDMQIKSGADAVQIFDTLGGIIPPEMYNEFSAQWIRRVVKSVKGRVPVILFSKGVHDNWNDLLSTETDVLGIDWQLSMKTALKNVPKNIGLQGNLDPVLLLSKPSAVKQETIKILSAFRNRNGHIFNLGHGVPPNARLETMEEVISTVRNYK